MFTIGDVLYISGMLRHNSVVVITNITYGRCDAFGSCSSDSNDVFYHVKVLDDGPYYSWFMDDSEICKHCNLMVSNLNDAERLAIAL